ncbi:SCO family protein [Devosia sp. Naph2]|uniref:SCO family protein n=1 Tax=Devosia polycyclovorans TaxID=3345148 RepID=UPI0035D10564
MTTHVKKPALRNLRLALWAAAIALVIAPAGALVWRAYTPAQVPKITSSGEATIRSEFSLVDHTGRAVTEADFAGKWQLVFFGFTFCPDICPTTLAYMGSVLDLMGEQADEVVPLFITVDPERDTPEVMAEYVAAFHPDLVGLTGTEEQIAQAASNFRTWYERMEDASAPDGYMMAHAGHMYLMRPDGRFEAVFQEQDQSPETMAAAVLQAMQAQ